MRPHADLTTPAIGAYGRSAPQGASVVDGGVNFSLYSRDASGVELLLFDDVDDVRAAQIIPLDPVLNHTYHYWHVFVAGLAAGQLYGYRVHGPVDPANGLRFDSAKLLLDPYGRGVAVPRNFSRAAAQQPGDTIPTAMKSVVIDPRTYDWEGDAPIDRPVSQTIVYEMHVKGFTQHPNSGVAEVARGTYRGVIERISYLRDLGVTAVELLPVFQFDPYECPPGMTNYWGYSPVSFFAPNQTYSSVRDPLGAVDEFRDMVKALHRAGIEVILDVVFNHTAEGNEHGPTYSLRGIDNRTYYILEEDRSQYADYTGCGNTLNANHPVVRRMIVDSLRYWVEEMHIDGFRFDLASVLSRDTEGAVLPNPPVLWDIETDPSMAGTKMIAEAWDAAGLYQVGSFVGDNWKEWNGRFRDDVRSFLRGDDRTVASFADRLVGSHDIYGYAEREAEKSVNFVACHDGFTLNDLVSYDSKHNEANGHDNHDGSDDNRSWNSGVEGPTDDAEIERLRSRQVKNFLTITLMAMGLPMLLMGDEVRRTQRGNNNGYDQDNEISWFDWSLLDKYADVHRFTQLLIERRVRRDTADPAQEHMTLTQLIHLGIKGWHGVRLDQPDWGDQSHSLALSVELPAEGVRAHFIFNAYWEPLEFELPHIGGTWRRWIDTSLASPEDVARWEESSAVPGWSYQAGPRSVVIVWAALSDG